MPRSVRHAVFGRFDRNRHAEQCRRGEPIGVEYGADDHTLHLVYYACVNRHGVLQPGPTPVTWPRRAFRPTKLRAYPKRGRTPFRIGSHQKNQRRATMAQHRDTLPLSLRRHHVSHRHTSDNPPASRIARIVGNQQTLSATAEGEAIADSPEHVISDIRSGNNEQGTSSRLDRRRAEPAGDTRSRQTLPSTYGILEHSDPRKSRASHDCSGSHVADGRG